MEVRINTWMWQARLDWMNSMVSRSWLRGDRNCISRERAKFFRCRMARSMASMATLYTKPSSAVMLRHPCTSCATTRESGCDEPMAVEAQEPLVSLRSRSHRNAVCAIRFTETSHPIRSRMSYRSNESRHNGQWTILRSPRTG